MLHQVTSYQSSPSTSLCHTSLFSGCWNHDKFPKVSTKILVGQLTNHHLNNMSDNEHYRWSVRISKGPITLRFYGVIMIWSHFYAYIRTPLPPGFRKALLCCREYEILLCCLFSLQDSISASRTKSCFPPRSIYPETLLSAGVRICWEAICLLFQATRTPPPPSRQLGQLGGGLVKWKAESFCAT